MTKPIFAIVNMLFIKNGNKFVEESDMDDEMELQ